MLGSLILYLKGLKGMRIMMFQLSGFCYNLDEICYTEAGSRQPFAHSSKSLRSEALLQRRGALSVDGIFEVPREPRTPHYGGRCHKVSWC